MRLLHLDPSIPGQHSVSRALSAAFAARGTAVRPGIAAACHDLNLDPRRHRSGAHLAAFHGVPATDPALDADMAAGGYAGALAFMGMTDVTVVRGEGTATDAEAKQVARQRTAASAA